MNSPCGCGIEPLGSISHEVHLIRIVGHAQRANSHEVAKRIIENIPMGRRKVGRQRLDGWLDGWLVEGYQKAKDYIWMVTKNKEGWSKILERPSRDLSC